MNKNFADWYRTAALAPENKQLQDRSQGIEKYCKSKVKCQDVINLARLFFKLPISEDFKNSFIDPFYNIDNAFSQINNDMELSVLAGATLIHIVENNINELKNISLLAIKSASFKRTPVVSEILKALYILFDDASLAIRKINLISEPLINVPSFKAVEDQLKQIESTNSWPPKETAIAFSAILKGINKTFTQIDRFLEEYSLAQKIYREDSQVLWWLFSEFSKDMNKPIRELKITETSIIIGKELADIIEVLPGPYSAEAVLCKMLSIFSEDSKEIALSTAINQTDKKWREKTLDKYKVEKTKEVTPILVALSESLRVDKAEDWPAPYKKLTGIGAKDTHISAVKLSYQVYLECLLLKAYENCEDKNV